MSRPRGAGVAIWQEADGAVSEGVAWAAVRPRCSPSRAQSPAGPLRSPA